MLSPEYESAVFARDADDDESYDAGLFWPLVEELDKRGVLFLENFGWTSSEGHCYAHYERSGEHQFGYVFFNQQDTSQAVEDGSTYLAFGSFTDDEDNYEQSALLVGQTFVATATELGFDVKWNESVARRILISGLPPSYFKHLIEEAEEEQEDEEAEEQEDEEADDV